MASDKVILPRRLTVENGAKYLLSGEFFEEITIECTECGGDGCDDCLGNDLGSMKVPVSWTNIKKIYAMIVDNMAEEIENGK